MILKSALRLCSLFFILQILSLNLANAYDDFSNKCIEIDGMYMNFDQFSSAAYMSPINGGNLVKVSGSCDIKYCFITAYITDKFKHEITINYTILQDTNKYTKEILTVPTDKERLEKENALKKGIPFEYKFELTKKTSGEWNFIECKGRK